MHAIAPAHSCHHRLSIYQAPGIKKALENLLHIEIKNCTRPPALQDMIPKTKN